VAFVPPDPEWIALEAGLKPAVRIALRDGDAQKLAAGLASRGAAVVLGHARVQFEGRERETVLYVARRRDDAEALRDAESRALGVESDRVRLDAHREMGRLLGYPRCCVDAFLEVAATFDAPDAANARECEDVLHARGAISRTRGLAHARVNPLLLSSRMRLVTFYPCRYDCTFAVAYANALHAAIARKDARAASELDRVLACEIALASHGARALIETDAQGHRRAVPPPRPNGMPDHRNDRAFADAIDAALARGAAPEVALRIVFAHPSREPDSGTRVLP
jgi:hypothetical protein